LFFLFFLFLFEWLAVDGVMVIATSSFLAFSDLHCSFFEEKQS